MTHAGHPRWRRTGGDDNGLLGALEPVDLLIKLSDARSRSGSQQAAERQRLLSSRDRPSFAAVATAGMCHEPTLPRFLFDHLVGEREQRQRHFEAVDQDQPSMNKCDRLQRTRAPIPMRACVVEGPQMIGLIVALLSVLLPLIHLGLSRHPRTRGRVIHLLLLYALVLDVGVIGLPPGSPFQFEVGIHDGAWGLLGFLCLWIGGSFWLATGLGWSVFMLGASYGHLDQTLREGDYAPYNFLTIFSDGFIAVWLLVLLYLYYREGGFRKQDQVSGQQRQTLKESG